MLNSVNVSTSVINERLRTSKAASFAEVAALLRQQNGGLAEFLTTDPRGRLVPELLGRLAESLQEEQRAICEEAGALVKSVAHIRDIVAVQQNAATSSHSTEPIPPAVLVEDALRMNAASLAPHDIEIVREFAAVRAIPVDRHKALQILVNLIRNAQQSMVAHAAPCKVLTLTIREEGGRMRIAGRAADDQRRPPPAGDDRAFGGRSFQGRGPARERDARGFHAGDARAGRGRHRGREGALRPGAGRGAFAR